ncbi:hypothetical protein [Ralstonia pseudosolanacearum]|uniref:hypothetical protein n=1 Tax=Ralstonia pseudosolanacearum TaxID=1310165 RepID=UPI000490C3AE|nr:hypothetical protein [Ralstonia pseudosolanacearum]MDO3559583.1 hypothetical protein [Ralstonia pseudosolanacearum]MDO3579486.1 hypothetical protein [Ralstonia pseudosolanacearum]MDO3589406.1 hypothetical protein [Ralstonia pseudosolanacearum]
MSKQITERAQQGQTFFDIPADRTAPVAAVTVNGNAAAFTSTPNGVNLNTPATQGDVVVVTFDQQF